MSGVGVTEQESDGLQHTAALIVQHILLESPERALCFINARYSRAVMLYS